MPCRCGLAGIRSSLVCGPRPSHERAPRRSRTLTALLVVGILKREKCPEHRTKFTGPQTFARLACSRVQECIFGEEIETLREDLFCTLEVAGQVPRRRSTDRPSLIEFRLFAAYFAVSAGPERDLASFAEGVRIAVGVKLPRVLAVYTRKKKWSLPEQENSELHCGRFRKLAQTRIIVHQPWTWKKQCMNTIDQDDRTGSATGIW